MEFNPRGVREVGRGGEKRASFEAAIRSLDRKLRALGARHGMSAEPMAEPPPAEGGEEEWGSR